jgi:hypothetical protein
MLFAQSFLFSIISLSLGELLFRLKIFDTAVKCQ